MRMLRCYSCSMMKKHHYQSDNVFLLLLCGTGNRNWSIIYKQTGCCYLPCRNSRLHTVSSWSNERKKGGDTEEANLPNLTRCVCVCFFSSSKLVNNLTGFDTAKKKKFFSISLFSSMILIPNTIVWLSHIYLILFCSETLSSKATWTGVAVGKFSWFEARKNWWWFTVVAQHKWIIEYYSKSIFKVNIGVRQWISGLSTQRQ